MSDKMIPLEGETQKKRVVGLISFFPIAVAPEHGSCNIIVLFLRL